MAVMVSRTLLGLGICCAIVFAAEPYPHDVICNNGTSHACICYQADQSMREFYSDCEVFMKPNVEISLVVLVFSGLNLNGHTSNGDPYETQFKSTVATLVSNHCQKHAQECPGTMLPVEADRVILMGIQCQGPNNEETRVSFAVTQNKNSFQIAPWFLLDAGLILRILTIQQRQLSQGVGSMRIRQIYTEDKVKQQVPYPEQPIPGGVPVPITPKPKSKLDNNKVLVYILSGIGCSLCICYIIAIYKVCVDYHQRKRQEKEPHVVEEKDQLNNGQSTAYGAIGDETNKKDAAVTMIVTTESFSKQKLVKRQSQTSLNSESRKRLSRHSSKRSSNSSIASGSSNQQKKVTHTATINRSQESDSKIESEGKRQRTESASSVLAYEDTGYYIPEPQPMPPTPPDDDIDSKNQNQVNIIDNPMAEIAGSGAEYTANNQYAAPVDANGYSYGYNNEHYQTEGENGDDKPAVDSVTQDYYDNYTYTAEDGIVYYWDGQQWQYMYPDQVIAAQQQNEAQYDNKSMSSTSTPPVYSEQTIDEPDTGTSPPSMPLPPLPPLPSRPKPKQQSSAESMSSSSKPTHPPPQVPPQHPHMQQIGKSVSLRSVKRLQNQSSITSNDGVVGAVVPMAPLVESTRSATLTDVRPDDTKTQESDLSSDSDSENEQDSPNQVEQPPTRIVPYHQLPYSLTPMQSMEHHQPDTSGIIKPVAAAPPPPIPPIRQTTQQPNKAVPVQKIESKMPTCPPPPDPFGMTNDESVWTLPPEPSVTNHINGGSNIVPIRAPEKTPLPSQFASSNEHLVNVGEQPYEDVSEFKMMAYEDTERVACDSEGSSDAASSSEDEMETSLANRTQYIKVVDQHDPYDVDKVAEVCGSHDQHLQLASNDYQRLAESNLSMNVTATDNTNTTAVSDDESLR